DGGRRARALAALPRRLGRAPRAREARVDAIMRRAMGNDRSAWTVRRVMPWRRSQFTADRYAEGRILLAGDAAHTTSPTGGHGLNTGIGGVSEIGGVVAALLRGWGGDQL